MPIKSDASFNIPQCSFPTFLFKSSTQPLSDSRISFAEAARPDSHFFTPSSFRLWSQRFALGLRKSSKFKRGDRILLFSGNDLFFPVAFMGILMAGGIFTGANPAYVARELAYQLKDSDALYLLCAEVGLDTGIEAAKLIGFPLQNIFVFDNALFAGPVAPNHSSHQGYRHWGELFASPGEAKSFTWDDLAEPGACHQTLALNYSSGTTGRPKGVEITHHNYVSNTLQYVHMAAVHPDFKLRNERARWLCILPLYHAMAQTIMIAAAFHRGIPVYIMSKFEFLQMLAYVQQLRLTDLLIVPPIVVALAKHPATKNYDISSLTGISSGAAPMGQEVITAVESLWPTGEVKVRQGWGMTEATCSVLGWRSTEDPYSFSVGGLNANCEARIMAEDGVHEIEGRGPSFAGELWVRGPNIMKGYWRNPTATAETLTSDGWLKTGDIAYVDSNDKFFIVDRKKELIKVKGNQVAPAELEALLLEHPSVADAAVIGLPTADGDERPTAYIVLQGDEKSLATTQQDLVDYVAGKVARYKRITGGVVWIDVVPKNPSGKILRRALRDRAKEKETKVHGPAATSRARL